MDNIFTAAARNIVATENGHTAIKSTGSKLLDLYGQIGALRDAEFDTRVWPMFEKALQEDPLLATKIMFYGRDARGGTGERELFRNWLRYAGDEYPGLVEPNIALIPEYGRWDDVYALVGTKLEKQAWALIYMQFTKDMQNLEAGKPVSLLGKWLKSCNTSSQKSVELGHRTRMALSLTEREYRMALSRLREAIRIVERDMSRNNWGNIQYDKLPSRAGLIYRDAFMEHDPVRYKQYIEDVKNGKAKINTAMNTPQDIVHAYGMSSYHRPNVDETLEAMWKNLPDFVNTDENIMVMADVSGSMTGRPMEVSVGLAMYFAQHNRGAFHNLFMTFESQPQFVAIEDNATLRDNLFTIYRAPWRGSTDLNLACEQMLKFAKAKGVPAGDMPRRLIIVSDMEIDQATRVWHPSDNCWRGSYISGDLHIDELRQMYDAAGYPMPQVIYWNVESRANHFQTTSDKPGVMLASGSSPAIFEALIAMKNIEITPYDAMIEVLNSPRYSEISIA